MKKLAAFGLVTILGYMVFPPTLYSQQIKPPALNLALIKSGYAFAQFENRPVSELSKLLYLIDRLGERDVEIRYGSHSYRSKLISGIARWYLSRHYKKERAEDWLQKWCYRTLRSGNPVWIKLDDGSLRSAKEVIKEELDHLGLLSGKL